MSFYGISPVLFESVSNTTGTLGVNSPELGYKVQYAGEDYVYIYNAGGTDVSPGYAVVLNATTGYSCTISSVTNAGGAFGLVKHATIAAGEYGFVLTRGFIDAVNGMASTAPAAGNIVELAANGKFTVSNIQLATGAAGVPFGVVQSAGASGGTGSSLSYLYVKCMG